MDKDCLTSADRRIQIDAFNDDGLASGPRKIQIYLPDGYFESSDAYPAIYFHDGAQVFSYHQANMLEADKAHDRLVEAGLINPCIIVAIFNSSVEGRVMDLTPTKRDGGGGLGGYYKLIAERLKPYIDSRFRTMAEAASTGVAGVSLGGSASFLMAYAHPETFGMAGCMSPSLWWDDYALELVRNGSEGRKHARFWLDAGGGEYDMWQDVAQVYEMLEQQGWIPGDDLAAYFDYHADHDWQSFQGRAGDMLYFLLRKEPLALNSYRLVNTANPENDTLDLSTRRRRLVGAEAWYSHGLRLTVPKPDIQIDDPSVVCADPKNPSLLHEIAPGETTITSVYQRHRAQLSVVSSCPRRCDDAFECPQALSAHRTGTDWARLPHEIDGPDGMTAARFGVSYDREYVHIVVHVPGVPITTASDKLPWERNSIWFRFDARPEATLRKGEGYGHRDDFLQIGMLPKQTDEKLALYVVNEMPFQIIEPESPEWERFVPAGVVSLCVTAAGGYNAKLSVPTAYLDSRQEDRWTVFRFNLVVIWLDADGERHWASWQPDWLKFDSPVGSGIFRRELPLAAVTDVGAVQE